MFRENEGKGKKIVRKSGNQVHISRPFCFLVIFAYITVLFLVKRILNQKRMRKHGWQLPYHPLQVVAVAVFLALGFAFYVFFAPFVGKKLFQYIVMGLYSPLIVCVIGLYIWCAASDPADPGVFKSKKYIRVADNNKSAESKESKLGGDSVQDANAAQTKKKIEDSHQASRFSTLLRFLPCAFVCNCSDQREKSSEQTSEDGMFYCSLCEVEVFKYSKHCRVCDKCVDRFDHHCRWLNNCVGKRNYRKFFTLMVSALLLLILQWSTGILVLTRCFIENKRFYAKITSNLGSSFSVAPFVIVVAVCTILAMIATLPIAQLFFFHILLIKKGISTYDYIMALREQEQQGQQSPQMSTVSSLTGLSSASSMSTFRRAAWCTPPPLFLEDQFDVVPPDNVSVSSRGRKTLVEEPFKKKNPAPVKINPWTLARLNAEDVSKAAAEARKKSKILQPVVDQQTPRAPEANKRRPSKRVRLPSELPFENLTQLLSETGQRSRGMMITETSSRSAFATVVSSPESSLDSPDIHPLRVSSSGAEDARHLPGGLSTLSGYTIQKEIPLSSSTSDGYDASGGEDSDRVPSRFVQRLAQWSGRESRLVLPSSSSSSLQANNRRRRTP